MQTPTDSWIRTVVRPFQCHFLTSFQCLRPPRMTMSKGMRIRLTDLAKADQQGDLLRGPADGPRGGIRYDGVETGDQSQLQAEPRALAMALRIVAKQVPVPFTLTQREMQLQPRSEVRLKGPRTGDSSRQKGQTKSRRVFGLMGRIGPPLTQIRAPSSRTGMCQG